MVLDDNASRPRTRTSEVVYWPATSFNNYGEVTVGPAEDMEVRIEKTKTETLDPQGNTIGSDYLLNVPKDVAVGSLFWLDGNKESLPNPIPELFQVIDFDKVPNVKGRRFDRSVKLIRHSNKNPELTP